MDTRFDAMSRWLSKPILTANEAAQLLGFNSVNSLLRARKRGLLPIEMFQLPGRRGWFAASEAVVGWVASYTRDYRRFSVPPEHQEGGDR